MTTTLITGANKGLGLETARQLVAAGHTVYVGARDARRGEEAAHLIGARPLLIDVTSDESVQAAAKSIERETGRLDVLVNNAGINGRAHTAEETTGADLLTVFDTNVFGAVRTVHAFLPLLRASGAPVVVNVSSGLGSLTVSSDPEGHATAVPVWIPALAYASSKAALNMVTVQYAHAFPGIRFNAVDPGYTATDLNGHTGDQTIEEGAEIIVRMATIGSDGPTGGYFSLTGPVPW
ncbi:SDR family oxidoreductase [Streptomyces sp. NA02950]|uniref:SDR family oxidoreductase n=1 Tax=Streptomyces sp. NA02950 TaxID=2742137 RepID=UPI0015922D23|nr:SDR family oxidoreductase [Streptomyces sp. NA02950]QKV94479.1 SDR family oxidoreductase [Streptomyces sp. NA02950]